MKYKLLPAALAGILCVTTISDAAAGLVIVPTFDSTITSDPNAATIESTINAAIQVYETNFNDAVTVNITFKEMGAGLGQSLTYYDDVLYSDFVTAIQAQATTTNDTIAVAHIPVGPNNPITGDAYIRSTLPNLRALGFPNETLPTGIPDSTISINTSICNLDRVTIDPGKYDLMAVAMHEMDEVLGTPSGIGEAEPRIADLFRYDSFGNRTHTTSGDNAYFSLDGTTELARYNQNAGADYGDWWSIGAHTPKVQDAYGTSGATPNLTVELILLDALGWTLNVPTTIRIQSVVKSGSNVTFTWNSVSGKNYQVLYKTNLLQTAWSNLGAPIPATGPSSSYSDTIGTDPRRFYRVEQLAGPSPLLPGAQAGSASKTAKPVTHYFRPQ